MRNRDLGSVLLDSTYKILAQRGYGRACAVVWHNNWPSIRAFHKAGATLDHGIVVIRFRLWRRAFYFRSLMKGPRIRKILAAPMPKRVRQP